MTFAVPNEGTGKFERRQIVVCLLLPADQNATPPRQPSKGAFHHPAPGGLRFLLLSVELFFTDASEVLVG
jgi:hypothetical protein